MENENKTTMIKLRISPEQKIKIKKYCKENNQPMSRLIRNTIDKIINNK